MGALDPGKDYGLLQSLGNELDEFVEMYYSPCIAALFGTNIGSNPDVEPQYFLAYGWLTHDACAHLSCLADNMRWDRRLGGCTAGTVPYYIMNHFCMPQLTGNVAEQILIDEVVRVRAACSAHAASVITELMHFLKVIIVRTYIL